MKKSLKILMKDGLNSGIIKPLFSCLYSRDKLKNAFMDAYCKLCIGKIVMKVQQMDSNSEPVDIPRFLCFESRTYLLITDSWNNLFVVKLVDFLIEHGAKNIFVALTTKTVSENLNYYYSKIWQGSEAKVVLKENVDLSKQSNARLLLTEASKHYLIDTIFDLQQTEVLSVNSLPSKYLITKNLFDESKKVCIGLRDFVIFTTPKDSDENFNVYLFQDSNLITLCENRIDEGLPARLILWDLLKKVVNAECFSDKETKFLAVSQCMQELDTLMTLSQPNVIVSNSSNSSSSTLGVDILDEKSEKELFEDYIFNRVRELDL